MHNFLFHFLRVEIYLEKSKSPTFLYSAHKGVFRTLLLPTTIPLLTLCAAAAWVRGSSRHCTNCLGLGVEHSKVYSLWLATPVMATYPFM